MCPKTDYSPIILYKEDIQSIIDVLLSSGHHALAGRIDAKAHRSKTDSQYIAALPSLADDDFDVDDEPVVAAGEEGAYVMVWHWITNEQAGIHAPQVCSPLKTS